MYIDIGLFVVMALFGLLGVKFGLSRLILKLAPSIIALILMFFLTSLIKDFFVNTNFLWISGSIEGAFNDSIGKKLVANGVDLNSTDYELVLKNSGIWLGTFLERFVIKREGFSALQNISFTITNYIMILICAVIIYLVVWILFRLLRKLVKKLREKEKAFHIVDSVLGIFGYISYYLLGLLTVLSIIYAIPVARDYFNNSLLNNTVVAKYLFNNNPIGFLIDSIVKLFV